MGKGFITGEKVFLRGFERADLKNLQGWVNDPEVTHFMFMGDRPALMERLEEDWERESRSMKDIVFAVVGKESEKAIGLCGLYGINSISRHSELRIILGEAGFWGKGYGTEVCKLLLDYAFMKLNLNKVWLGVNADNPAGLKCYENAGFKREGVLRQEIYRNGHYYDAVRLSVLREEYAI